MKAGDLVELIETDHPYKGEIGIVVKIDWRDSERAWIFFDNWLRDEVRQVTLRPRWWHTTSFKIVGHQDDHVYPDFQEVLEQWCLKHVNFAQISDDILEKWGLVLGVEDVEALFETSVEKP